MAENTEISWCDATFNPWWGCLKVSPGCQHCYAETWANRYGHNIWGPAKTTGRRLFGDEHWKGPRKWNTKAEKEGRRLRVFCSSMADVFEDHPAVEGERRRLFELILDTPHLDWLLLTKRPENIEPMLRAMQVLKRDNVWDHLWPHRFPNVWLGTSIESQEQADKRIPELLRIPAAVRFLSCEPLIGPVNITDQPWWDWRYTYDFYPPGMMRRPIDWVICGGESGPKARPMNPEWARALRDQCQVAGVAYHFKQWGEWEPYEEDAQPPFWQDTKGNLYDGHGLDILDPETGGMGRGWHEDSLEGAAAYRRVGKKAAGRLLDGRTWDEFPR